MKSAEERRGSAAASVQPGIAAGRDEPAGGKSTLREFAPEIVRFAWVNADRFFRYVMGVLENDHRKFNCDRSGNKYTFSGV